MYKANFKKIPGIVLKALFWVAVSLVGLLVLVWILIRFQFVQDFAKEKTVNYLQKKLGTKVVIQHLGIDFPNRIVLQNVYFEDRQKDTLLAGGKLLVDISMLGLLNNKVSVSNVELKDFTVNILRNKPDTVFNFDYIIKAFDSGSNKKVKKDSSKPMIFQFGLVQLSNVHFRFKDQLAGLDSRVSIGLFKTTIKKIEPTIATYETGLIQLKDLGFVLTDSSSLLSTNIQVKQLALHAGVLNLNQLLIPVQKFQADSANIYVRLGKPVNQVKNVGKQAPDTAKSLKTFWRVLANQFNITNANIQFDDDQHAIQNVGMDYFHLNVKGLNIKTDSLDLSSTGYAGKIVQLDFKEKSGFELKELVSTFSYSNEQASVKGFQLKTNKSSIQTDFKLSYASLESLTKQIGDSKIDLNLKDSKLAISDLLLLSPNLQKQLSKHTNLIIEAGASIKGKLSDLSLSNVYAKGYGRTQVKLNGRIKGLPDINKTYFQLPSITLLTSRKDILQVLPAKTIPTNINIPETIKVAGSFNGTIQSFGTKFKAITSSGNLDLNAVLSLNKKSYDASLNLDRFDLGKLLQKDSLLGKISMQAQVKGVGFDYKTLVADTKATLQEFQLKGYNYQNLLIDGKADHGNFQISSLINDPNIQFNLQANTNLKQGYPDLKLDLLLDTMNFKALHFTNDSFALHAKLKVDFSNTNPDSLEGEAFISQIKFSRGWHHFSTDTARIKASIEGAENHLTLFSKPLIADLLGKYRLTELPIALQHSINKYYQLQDFKDTAFAAQDWRASFQFRTSPIVLQFMPELKGTDTIGATMHFVSDRNLLDLQLNAPLIQYDGNRIRKLHANLGTGETAINYHVGFENAAIKRLLLNNATFNGSILENTVYGNLIFRNKIAEKIYQLSLSMKQQGKGLKFHLNPDSLLLNKQTWQVDPLNAITYDSSGLLIRNLLLQYKDQSIAVNNRENIASSPLDLSFKNFSIRTITDMIRQDSIGAEGVINGQAIIRNATTKPVFTSDISIAGFAYDKRAIGDLQIKVDNETANRYKADIVLTGDATHASVNGFYDTGEGNMDLRLLMDSLSMTSIIPFSAGHIRDVGGVMQANLHLTGNLEKPRLNGDFQFEKAFVIPTMLGQKFQLENEKVLVTDNGLHFDHFTLTDTLGKKAVLDGNIQTADLRNFALDLSLNANDFNLINSTQADNQLFYGKLNMDANVKLKGSLESPELNATLRANKKTDLTVVLPSSDPELQSREGVVNFIDTRKNSDSTYQVNLSDTLAQKLSLMKGLILSAIIETDTSANFTLVIDSRTGDALTVRGKSSLSAGMDQSGKLSLTGLYEVQKGSYQISFNLLKKKFEIVKGSTITWTGDPMSAIVDIKAMYTTKASPIDLVESELGGLTNTELNKYKQRLPVEVYLIMKGDLLKPQISFDVVIPEPEASKWPVVEDKLTQLRLDESEINKQVFALLILGRFIGEDITQNNTGTTTTGTMMRQSVSGILSDQLNKVASGLIKGVDINVGLESQDDYSSGTVQTRTDLRVGLSRTMNNDRIKVNVGTNVPIEGGSSASNASMIAGDVTVDYLLSKDGRYMLRTYSKNSYEGVIEGQIIETGLTFVITLEYDHWREIFKKKAASDKEAKNKKQSEPKLVPKQ